MVVFDLFHPQSFVKAFAISVPLICLLLSWASSAATPEVSSAIVASQVLRSRGYVLFATLISTNAAASGSWNGTGTVLAVPDSGFSYATAKFTGGHRPRPSASLLLYHTLKGPLTWHNLTELADGVELPTWHSNLCLFVSKGYNGDLTIVGSKKTIMAVKIRQPDLYVDNHLAIHGVDGVLDPMSASKCSVRDRTTQIISQIERSLLDHTIQALKRRRFSVVAAAIAIRGSNLSSLTSITIFAPSDASLFSGPNGFRYDFLHHVVPKRYRFTDIARLASIGTSVIQTLSPNKTVAIRSEGGEVTVNGVAIDSAEVYHNRWVTVLSVSQSIDDTSNSEEIDQISGSGAPPSAPSHSGPSAGQSAFLGVPSVPLSLPQSHYGDFNWNNQFSGHTVVPSPASSYSDEVATGGESLAPAKFGDHGQGEATEISSISAPPATHELTIADLRCPPGVSPASPDGEVSTPESQELFCPVTVLRPAEDSRAPASAVTEQFPPSIAYSQVSEKLVQSGPSHEFNKASEAVIDVGRRELSSKLRFSSVTADCEG